MEHAVALTHLPVISVEDLPERIRNHRGGQGIDASDAQTDLVPLEEVERRYILRVLDAVAGNKSVAARVLGVERKTLYRKLEEWRRGQS
jgi:two-component system response regulator HydG